MNTGLKNKLLVLAAVAGLATFGAGCGSSEEAPAADDSMAAPADATTGGEAAPAADAPAEGAAPADGAAAGGEGSCGEGSCS